MLDFTSALYLGFEHASWSLPGWDRLTLGKPAALEEIPGAAAVQRELAALTGCERVLLGSSTLHLFCDLFAMLARRNVTIWMDEATYPIARWGADRAAAAGVPVRRFAHHDAAALRRGLSAEGANRPVIVTDGFCPVRGTHAPLREYARCAAARDGLLVVDDTQALGVFGRDAGSGTETASAYGMGGGGSLQCFGLCEWDSDSRDRTFRNTDFCQAEIVVVSSLAKAFGAPVAMLGGSRAFVERFHETSATLVHCSPPSAAAISAAGQALQMNRDLGDALRRRLLERVDSVSPELGGTVGRGQFVSGADVEVARAHRCACAVSRVDSSRNSFRAPPGFAEWQSENQLCSDGGSWARGNRRRSGGPGGLHGEDTLAGVRGIFELIGLGQPRLFDGE